MTTVNRSAAVRAICDEAVWLYCIRTHFAELFEGNDVRRSLLQEVAATFFHDINVVLLEHFLLQVCKLTDPASSGPGKDNLTTNFLLTLEWTEPTRAALSEANEGLMQFRAKVVDARRKLIAHSDLRARLNSLSLGNFTQEDEQAFWESPRVRIVVASIELEPRGLR